MELTGVFFVFFFFNKARETFLQVITCEDTQYINLNAGGFGTESESLCSLPSLGALQAFPMPWSENTEIQNRGSLLLGSVHLAENKFKLVEFMTPSVVLVLG